jgi:heptosyltransferase-3
MSASRARKALERAGRGLLVRALGLLGVRRRVVSLPLAPRLLVIRLDERLGNLLLLTPVLASLRARFPDARLDVLGQARGAAVLAGHPAIDAFLPYRKWALFAADGPVGTLLRLRRRPYDLCMDLSNPTDPSATQAILTRLSGARHTVGAARPGFGRLYSAPVRISVAEPHEVALRLQLLAPLPGIARVEALSVAPLPVPPGSPVAAFVDSLANAPYVLCNLGARLPEKRLSPATYAALAQQVQAAGLLPVLAYGPAERGLAEATAAQLPAARLAPPSSVSELALLIRHARAVISCDTGPMHLAVACGTPTCAIFVSTDPARYGHPHPPHLTLDARAAPPTAAALGPWLATVGELAGPSQQAARAR